MCGNVSDMERCGEAVSGDDYFRHPSDTWLGELSDKMQSYDDVRNVGICSPAYGSVSSCGVGA